MALVIMIILSLHTEVALQCTTNYNKLNLKQLLHMTKVQLSRHVYGGSIESCREILYFLKDFHGNIFGKY